MSATRRKCRARSLTFPEQLLTMMGIPPALAFAETFLLAVATPRCAAGAHARERDAIERGGSGLLMIAARFASAVVGCLVWY